MTPRRKEKRKPKPQGLGKGVVCAGSKLIMKMNLGSIVVGSPAPPLPACQPVCLPPRPNIVQAKKSSKKFNFAKESMGEKKIKIKNKVQFPLSVSSLPPLTARQKVEKEKKQKKKTMAN